MYETDQEQIEAIKSWWGQYGNWVIGGFIAFIMSFVGYNWYNSAEETRRFQASAAYEDLLINITSEAADEEARVALTSLLKSDYSDLGYGAMAALIEAKAAVDADDYDRALEELKWAESNADKSLMAIVLYRQAQILFALDELDQALAILGRIEGDGHQAVSEELKGDILLVQGKTDEARTAYQAAVDAAPEQGINNPYLQIKLDDLAVAE